jgi:hypothetical protein
MDNGHPVTQAELKAALAAQKTDLEAALTAQKNELMEAMRQIETNLLTAFHGYARGVSAHLHTLDVTNTDTSIRLSALEDRVMALETRRPH